MNTQNVNVKTAAQEPSERWGETPVLMFSGKYPDADRVMSRQLEFMDELHGAAVSADELEKALYDLTVWAAIARSNQVRRCLPGNANP